MRKRIISILLSVSMLFAGSTPAMADDSGYDSNGFGAEGVYQPAELVDGYYQIGNAGQLYWFAEQVNSGKTEYKARLIADIMLPEGMQWTPIGNYQAQYSGEFDGNDKSIVGLIYTDDGNQKSTSYVGLFGAVTGGTVKDFTLVEASVVTASGKYGAGIVVGNLTDGLVSGVTLTDCTLEKTTGNDVCLGGMVGYNAGTISKCIYSSGTVKSTGGGSCFVGGIAGRNGTKDAEVGKIVSCVNGAEVTTVSGFDDIGGVVGKNTNKTDADSEVLDCVNNGTVRGATSWGGSRVGGIVGNNDGLVKGCINNGSIYSKNTSAETSWDTEFSAGGIVGANDGEIECCGNSGAIHGIQHFGGIAGYFNNAAGHINNCWNTGRLYAEGYGGSGGTCIGGIVGHLLDGTVKNCWSQVYYRPYDVETEYSQFYHAGVAIVGVQEVSERYTGKVVNCWYSPMSWVAVNDADDDIGGTELVSSFAVKNGELAYLLNNRDCSEQVVWRQTLGEDPHPVIDDTHAIVYPSCGGRGFANVNGDTDVNHNFNTDGFCAVCDAYQNATLVTESNCETLGLTTDYLGYYAIENAGQLYWFSDYTTKYIFSFSEEADEGAVDANAVLIQDITVNENVLDSYGRCTDYSGLRVWLPICGITELTNSLYTIEGYVGTFDGNGHTIRGLFGICQAGREAGVDCLSGRAAEADPNYATGVVGILGNGGCIRNLTVQDSFFSGVVAGSFAGCSFEGTENSIENCVFDGHIQANSYERSIGSVDGGVVGLVLGKLSVKNSAVAGLIDAPNSESYYMGGVAGELRQEVSATLSCENVLYIKKTGSAEHLYWKNTSESIASCTGVVCLNADELKEIHTVGVPMTGLLSMTQDTNFDKTIFVLGGEAWADSDGTGIWPGKVGRNSFIISLSGKPVLETDITAVQGEPRNFAAAVSMAKQTAQQTLEVDLTSLDRYLGRGDVSFVLDDWTRDGLTSASINGKVLTLVAENTTECAWDSLTISVTGLLDYKDTCTLTIAVAYNRAATPVAGEGYVIHYAEETIEVLPGYEVNENADGSGTVVSSGSTVYPGSTLYIRNVGGGGLNCSPWTELPVPARPAAPDVQGLDETVANKCDGTITGTTKDMEYTGVSPAMWVDCAEGEVTGLEPQQYRVRYKSTETSFVGTAAVLYIECGPRVSVVFNSNGGSAVSPVEDLVYGEQIAEPDAPTKDGYEFAGWYMENTFETAWDFSLDFVEGNTTLYAKWDSIELTGTLTVTGDAEVGETLTATISEDTNNSGTLSYQWYRHAEESVLIDGATENTYVVAEEDVDWTLYCVVCSDVQERSIVSNRVGPVSRMVFEDGVISASGYTGLYDGQPHGISVVVPSGAGVLYSINGEDYLAENPTFAEVGNYTVYYRVYKARYVSVDGSAVVSIAKADSMISLAPAAVSDLAYTGDDHVLIAAGTAVGGDLVYTIGTDAVTAPTGGWSSAAPSGNAEGTYYVWYKVVGDTNHNDTMPDCVEVVIEAADLSNAYRIDYAKETITVADGYLASATQDGDYAVTISVEPGKLIYIKNEDNGVVLGSVLMPTRPEAPAGLGSKNESIAGKADGEIIGTTVVMEYKPRDGADWMSCTAEKVNNLADGTYLVRYKAVTEGEDKCFASAAATVIIGIGETVSVTFVENGGEPVDDLTGLTYNAMVTLPATTKIGHAFCGWATEAEGDAVYAAQEALCVTEDVTLYAMWITNLYEVTWNNGDGGEYMRMVAYGDIIALPDSELFTSTMYRAGYTIAEWVNQNGIRMGDPMPAENVSFVAQYTANAYTVVFDANGGEGAMPDQSFLYDMGVALTGNAFVREGYDFVGWSDGDTTYADGQVVKNLTAEANGIVTLYAQWELRPIVIPEKLVFEVCMEKNPVGGAVYASKSTAFEGEVITVTAEPSTGYQLTGIAVVDDYGNVVAVTRSDETHYEFEMPGCRVVVSAEFVESGIGCRGDESCPLNSYEDLDAGLWYHDGIHDCLVKGLMVGTGVNQFEPDKATTRAMIVTVLWRQEGCPHVTELVSFEDVPAGLWYTEAIRWAQVAGIVKGYSDESFGPNDSITREQMVTILWRYAMYKGYDVSVGEDTNILSYDDSLAVSEWAIAAMQWACGTGLVRGIANGSSMYLEPDGKATRAQVATVLFRFGSEVAQTKA